MSEVVATFITVAAGTAVMVGVEALLKRYVSKPEPVEESTAVEQEVNQ